MKPSALGLATASFRYDLGDGVEPAGWPGETWVKVMLGGTPTAPLGAVGGVLAIPPCTLDV